MFASVAVLALAGSLVSAAPVARTDKPSTYAEGYLEPYATYHTRYLALDCQAQHNTTFFDDCCHPLLANETLSARPSYCTPDATESSSAVAYESTAAAATTTATADLEAETEYAQATSTSTTTKASKTSSAAAETSSASSSSSSVSGDVKTGGYATYFYQGGNAGACGTVHSDSDKIVAIDQNGYWGSDTGSASSYCGKWVNIKNTNNGETVTAMVADVCPTCSNDNSLDLSVGAFEAIASLGDGMVPIEWSFA